MPWGVTLPKWFQPIADEASDSSCGPTLEESAVEEQDKSDNPTICLMMVDV
jgi:hypothetical protein